MNLYRSCPRRPGIRPVREEAASRGRSSKLGIRLSVECFILRSGLVLIVVIVSGILIASPLGNLLPSFLTDNVQEARGFLYGPSI